MEDETEVVTEEPSETSVFEDDEFVDVDALYAEVRQLQRSLEDERAIAGETREKAFKKVRGLQAEVEKQRQTIEKLKKLEGKYYALVSEVSDLRDVAAAARVWAGGIPAEARQAVHQALAVLDGRGSAG